MSANGKMDDVPPIIGGLYRVDHKVKGRFEGRVLWVSDGWAAVVLTTGSPEDAVETGQQVQFRLADCRTELLAEDGGWD